MLRLNQVHVGNALQLVRLLLPKSINCVVTSPPYFGLRDYGTAEWEGGDPACDHVADASRTKSFGNPEFNENRPSRVETKTAGYYAAVCPKCGAVRQDEQIGLEPSPEAYAGNLVELFMGVHRALADDGTLWLNLGDSYANLHRTSNADQTKYKNQKRDQSPYGDLRDGRRIALAGNDLGLKDKDLIGIPWMVAFALRSAGWYLRSEIIWDKPNAMPESVRDRVTKSHETVFMLTKSKRYYFDADTILEPISESSRERWGDGQQRLNASPQGLEVGSVKGEDTFGFNAEGRRKRSVWRVNTAQFHDSHFATFPPDLIEPMILAGCPEDGVVLDPFFGSGTTGVVARALGRQYIGFELNEDYAAMATDRLRMPFEKPVRQKPSASWAGTLFEGLMPDAEA